MKKIIFLTAILFFLTNISFAKKINSQKWLFKIEKISPIAETYGYKIGDILIDNYLDIKFDYTEYLPNSYNNNNNFSYDFGNRDAKKFSFDYKEDRLLYRPKNEKEKIANGVFIHTKSIPNEYIWKSISWTYVKYDESYCESIRKSFNNWFKEEKSKINLDIFIKEKQEKESPKRILCRVKTVIPSAEALGYKVGDVFIDVYKNIDFDRRNYILMAFNDYGKEGGYISGNYEKYISKHINNYDEKIIYRPNQENETEALGTIIKTKALPEKYIYDGIKWELKDFKESYANSIKNFSNSWLIKEITNREKQKELEEKAILQAKIKRELDLKNKKRQERLNKKPTLGEKQALIKAKSYLNNVGGFSRIGMIKQLEFEGFSFDEAEYAVDMLGY